MIIAALWSNLGLARIIISDEAFFAMDDGLMSLPAHSIPGFAIPGFEFQTAETRLAISRRITPELMSEACPSRIKGSREGRVPSAPMVRVQQKARGRTTGVAGSSAFPAQWF